MLDPKLLPLFQKDTYLNIIGATMEAVEPGYYRVSIRVTEATPAIVLETLSRHTQVNVNR